MKKLIIWTSETFLDDDAKEEYQQCKREALDDEDYCVTDREWAEVVNGYLADEHMNLDKEIDGVIIAFADIGRWNGRRQGYKILGNTINDIFSISEDNNEWYSDGNNIRGILLHHDASHYVLYRVAKDRETAERLGDQIYNLEMDEAGFRKHTRSLHPYVAEIYGWKAGRFNKAKKAV